MTLPPMLSADEARRRARDALSPETWTYLERRANGSFRDRNAAAWRDLDLRPRVLRGIEEVDLSLRLLGRALDFPVLTTPNGRATRYHPDGEAAVLRATAAHGIGSVLPSSVLHAVEPLVVAAGVPPVLWGQLYIGPDPDLTLRQIDTLARAGAHAAVLTVDLVPHEGATAPASPAPADWEQGQAVSNTPLFAAAGIADVQSVVRRSSLPVVIKGVLRADDARACAEAGAQAIVVSNHGDAQLEGAVPTARALTEVRAAVGPEVEVLVDGGLRSGADVLRALALGASAVLIGRPVSHALAANGSDGVAAYLTWLKADLARVLALCGCARIAAVGADLIVQR